VDTRQKAVVVLGPGRSGTSALTRAVAALGVDLGANLKPGTAKNAKGFFEDLDLLDLNYELHEAFGLRRNGSSVRLVTDDDWKRVDLAPFRARLEGIVESRFQGSPCWGFKCGGVIRMLPFWEETLESLDQRVFYVFAVRNPLEVAGSRRKLDYFRGIREKCDLEWLTQVVPYFRAALSKPCVVVDYDRMLEDPDRELRRMARVLEIEVSDAVERGIVEYGDEFLSRDLRHNAANFDAFANDPLTNPTTRDGYRWLLRFAADEVEASSEEWSRDWERIERDVETMGPLLRHIDFLEDELRDRAWGLNAFLKTRLSRFGGGARRHA
jgi:hypothetical protein